jgi:hypothetical protein
MAENEDLGPVVPDGTSTSGQGAQPPLSIKSGTAPPQAPADNADGQARDPGPEPGQPTGQAPIAPEGPEEGTALPTEEPSFIDWQTSPELTEEYNRMRAAWTKKMQAAGELPQDVRNKIAAYDAFSQNPQQALQNLARQYGFDLGPATGQGAAPGESGETPWEQYEPSSWKEFRDRIVAEAKREVEAEVYNRFEPAMRNVHQLQTAYVERQLDEADPSWREYESDIIANLERYPGLEREVDKLLRISLPGEMIESRAMQAALKKIETRTAASGVAAQGTQRKAAPVLKPGKTFQDAIENARRDLASRGGR